MCISSWPLSRWQKAHISWGDLSSERHKECPVFSYSELLQLPVYTLTWCDVWCNNRKSRSSSHRSFDNRQHDCARLSLWWILWTHTQVALKRMELNWDSFRLETAPHIYISQLRGTDRLTKAFKREIHYVFSRTKLIYRSFKKAQPRLLVVTADISVVTLLRPLCFTILWLRDKTQTHRNKQLRRRSGKSQI